MSSPVYTTDTSQALVESLVLEICVNGGFSINPRNGQHVTEGFALAIHPDRERIIGGEVSPDDITQFVYDNADLFVKNNTVFGAWLDRETGLTYLDVSVIEYDRGTALTRARANNQLAIYDLDRKEEIYL